MAHKFIDLTNKKFGKLTSKYRIKFEKSKKAEWFCVCECGNTRNVSAQRLLNGKATKCISCPVNDYRSQKFGNLECIGWISQKRLWQCKCDCGKEIKIDTQKLLNSKSCGCRTGENIIGLKFRMLTIIEKTPSPNKNKQNHTYYKCLCDCGNYTTVSSDKIKNINGTISCGCVTRYIRPEFRGFGEITDYCWYEIVRRARENNIEFNLSPEYLNTLYIKQNKRCAYTYRSIIIRERNKSGTASLDRIDSSLGYIIGNVQWIYKDVNSMKMDMIELEFLKLVKEIYKNTIKEENFDYEDYGW